MATMPILFEKNIPHLFPLTAAREMYEPLHKLKFSFAAPYYDQIRIGVKWMAKERGAKKFCVIYQDDEFGWRCCAAPRTASRTSAMSFAEKTSFKRGATDFSAQVAKMKASDCDTVVMGTIIRETIGTIGTARKMGWNPQFIGSSALHRPDPQARRQGHGRLLRHAPGGRALRGRFLEERARLGGRLQGQVQGRARPVLRLRLRHGPVLPDAKKTGPNLTTDNFVKTLESTTFTRDMFGSPNTSSRPSSTWATTSRASARSRTASGWRSPTTWRSKPSFASKTGAQGRPFYLVVTDA
jgi:branched-chain amino acid transport system substrate-binding protein